jgi:hypothetical protein
VRKRFTPATILAMIALFVALAGTATAGGVLITGKQIKNGSVGLADLSSSAKSALKGQRGPVGPMGPQGAPGPAGALGPVGGFDPAKLQYITGPKVTLAPGQTASATAYCPPNTAAVSGGFFSSIGHIGFSETFGQTFHGVAVTNDNSIEIQINATVVCAGR